MQEWDYVQVLQIRQASNFSRDCRLQLVIVGHTVNESHKILEHQSLHVQFLQA